MATTDERLDALEARVHGLEEMRLAYETRLIGHDHLLQAAITNDAAHLIELREMRARMDRLDGRMDGMDGRMDRLENTTAAGFEALSQLIRRGLDLPEE